MIVLLIFIVVAIVVFTMGKKNGDKLAERYPILRRPIAALGSLSIAIFWIGVVGWIVWLNNRPPQLPDPPEPLPVTIHPPSLEGTKWTIYDRSRKDKSELSLALPSIKDKDGYAQVWSRYDDPKTHETTLTLVKYLCEFGRVVVVYDVFYDNGAYSGYSDEVTKEESKVDLDTAEGAGFLLACFDKKPSSVESD